MIREGVDGVLGAGGDRVRGDRVRGDRVWLLVV